MRDYLNLYSAPNDDRPLITDFDPNTGRPKVVIGDGFVIPAEVPVVEVPVEAPADEAPAEEAPADVEGQ